MEVGIFVLLLSSWKRKQLTYTGASTFPLEKKMKKKEKKLVLIQLASWHSTYPTCIHTLYSNLSLFLT